MMTKMPENIYQELLTQYQISLKKSSEDMNKPEAYRYMTNSEVSCVSLDNYKNGFVKNMALTSIPLSCDALFMAKNKKK